MNASSFAHNAWQVLKTLQARLRFIVVLAAVGLVIGKWDTLVNYWEKWTRPDAAAPGAASDYEFWCPMHPPVIRERPDTCPICNMPLSRRKKGEAGEGEALPAGVVSRVQLTPYRVALAGIATVPVEYRPLMKEIHAVGYVEFDERRLARIAVRVTGKSRIDKLVANVTGQRVNQGDPLALIYSPDLVVTLQNLVDARTSKNPELLRLARERLRLWGIEEEQIKEVLRTERGLTQLVIRSPLSGHVIRKYQVEGDYVEEGMPLYDIADLSSVWIEAQIFEHEAAFLREGLPVEATTPADPNRVFRGKVSFVHPHLDASTRTLRVRFDMPNPGHDLRPGMFADVRLRVPVSELPDFATQGDREGAALRVLMPAAAPLWQAGELARQRQGLVLAVPERAVIDTGHRRLVYREAEPNVFEGVEVALGPRCGDYYPLLHGLQAGDRIVTAGSFLVDAETRLTAGAASTYFGASGSQAGDRKGSAAARPSMTEDADSKIAAVRGKLSAADRQLVDEQDFCPILTNSRLGSMGLPVKLLLDGQPVFLCCKGCEGKAKADPAKTLRTVAELKARQKSRPHQHDAEAAEIEANLKALGPDSPLARAQRFCAVQKDSPLGSMGKPIKVMVNGKPVFVCCEGCVDEAKRLKK